MKKHSIKHELSPEPPDILDRSLESSDPPIHGYRILRHSLSVNMSKLGAPSKSNGKSLDEVTNVLVPRKHQE